MSYEADYRTLRRSEIPSGIAEDPSMRFDSEEDASLYFARELDHVKAKTYDRLYPQMTALDLFPVTSEVDPGANTITYYSYDHVGMAKIISNYATDLPRVDVKGTPTTVPIFSVGDSYGYSIQEMRAARYVGKGLDARKGNAAKYAIDNRTNQVAWAGDDDTKMMGVLSTWNDIPLYILPNGASGSASWESKTADEILADMNGMVKYVAKITNDVERPDTMALASDVFYDISARRLPDSDKTVLKQFTENTPHIKKVVPAPELMGGNALVNPYGKNIAFLYTDDPDKMAFEVPLPFVQHPMQIHGLEMEVPCEQRIAGLQLYYPLSALIAVGV